MVLEVLLGLAIIAVVLAVVVGVMATIGDNPEWVFTALAVVFVGYVLVT